MPAAAVARASCLSAPPLPNPAHLLGGLPGPHVQCGAARRARAPVSRSEARRTLCGRDSLIMSLHDALARRFPSFGAAAVREAVGLLVANDVLSLEDVRGAPDCAQWPGSQARERARAAQSPSLIAQAASDTCMRLLRAAQRCAPPAGPPPPEVRGASAAGDSAAARPRQPAARPDAESVSSSSESSSESESAPREMPSQRAALARAYPAAVSFERECASRSRAGPAASVRAAVEAHGPLSDAQRAARLEAARATALVGGAPASFGTWRSALRNYYAFADKVLGRRGNNALPPSPSELALWATHFRNPKTFGNYKSQVHKACRLLRLDCSAFDSAEASGARAAVRKRLRDEPAPKPAIGHQLLVDMLARVPDEATRGLFVAAFAFALRVPSEGLVIEKGDPRMAASFSFSDEDCRARKARVVIFFADGRVTLHLSRRKHVDHPSRILRSCWCAACKTTCPVHALGAIFDRAPVGTAPFAHLPSGRILGLVRRLAHVAGERDSAHFCTKSFRRGHAETLRRSGGRLAEILRAGCWRSGAFLDYMDREELEGDAMLEALQAGHAPARAPG